MFTKLELTLAGRYLRTKKKEGVISIVAALSIIGIALGVATLIIVLSVMNGFRSDLLARILGVNSQLSIYSNSRSIDNYQQLASVLRKEPAVKKVSPMIEGHAVIYNPRFKDAVDAVKVRGINVEDLKSNALVNNKDFTGNLKDFDAVDNMEDGVIIGEKMAEALAIYPGNEVTIITPQSSATVFGSIPKKKTFRVVGVFNVGMQEYDRYMVYIPLSTAQNLFNFGQGVESLGVDLKDVANVKEYGESLNKRIGQHFRVVDWQQANSQFFGAVQTERNVMFIILTMIILVASFNIIGGMIMLIKDKSQSIAILRTMGMEKRSVMRAFILVGSFNGIVGTLSGLVIGLLFCHNIGAIQHAVEFITGAKVFSPEIYFLSQLPAEVNWGEVSSVCGISLIISLLATIYPSWRASKLDPAEVLRYE